MSLENLSLEARDELASLAQTLAENPDTRKDFLRMTKKIKPGMPIPELDIEEHTNRAISASDARVQALESKLRERDAQSELEKRRNNLITNKNVRKEDIPEIEKLMLEKQIPSHDTAAEYFEYMRLQSLLLAGSILPQFASLTLANSGKTQEGQRSKRR